MTDKHDTSLQGLVFITDQLTDREVIKTYFTNVREKTAIHFACSVEEGIKMGLPAIILSDEADIENIIYAKSLGIVAYISRPISTEKLDIVMQELNKWPA